MLHLTTQDLALTLAALPSGASADGLGGLAGWTVDVITSWGPVGVGMLVAAENLFPPIPSEVVLPLAGYLASRDRMDLVLVIVAATAGAVVGALVLYEVGRRTGRERMRRLVHRLPLVDVEDLDRSEAWFARHGDASVLIGRCIPVVRSLISVPAGIERMPRGRFLLLTTIGSAVWNSLFVLAGYGLGERFSEVERYSGVLNNIVYAAIAVVLLLGVRRAVLRRGDR